MSNPTHLLSYQEVADLLGVSKRTVKRRTDARMIPFHRVGAQVRFTWDDVERYLASTRTAGNL
jgi:excisionase family DNA binding protein